MVERDRQGRPLPAVSAGRQVVRSESVAAAQVVAAAGTAIVGAAKVGRLLTRSGWGLARRLPGGQAVQREVQRLQDVALTELRRLLDVPPGLTASAANGDERRVMMLIQNSAGADPLRSAMNELLERSVETDRHASREYLYGNIISQLVPDEARILAALSDGTPFAACDVIAKRRSTTRVVLANASTVGRSAGVVTPDNVPTYVTRLQQFGLVQFGPPDDSIAMQFDILATDSAVQAAEASIEARRMGSVRLARKTLSISPFGREFWAAADPSTPR
ncbi:MAG: hypothetical protein QOK11_3633 [Pseudonocardiales bacterium]|nr:hypothetical protein [Pseudonocardiales bacterium]